MMHMAALLVVERVRAHSSKTAITMLYLRPLSASFYQRATVVLTAILCLALLLAVSRLTPQPPPDATPCPAPIVVHADNREGAACPLVRGAVALEYPECAPSQQPKWSQDGEDWNVYRAFFKHRREPGTVLEMGALDGVGLSNSLFFERCLGWRAILLEGQPANCLKLFENRPHATSLCMAVCGPVDSTLQFTSDPGPIAGAVEAMSTEFKPGVEKRTVTVPCGPLSKYLAILGVRHIDFFSLDVEGAELVVLDTIDWTALTVDVMIVERDHWHPERDREVQARLEQRAGMQLHPNRDLTPRSDLYVRKGFVAL
jgi:FkbM family methyltransferase